jgi:hypothetical protein
MLSVPEIIDPVFTKTSPKRSFCMTENERFGLVFTKTGSINSGTGCITKCHGSKTLRKSSHNAINIIQLIFFSADKVCELECAPLSFYEARHFL